MMDYSLLSSCFVSPMFMKHYLVSGDSEAYRILSSTLGKICERIFDPSTEKEYYYFLVIVDNISGNIYGEIPKITNENLDDKIRYLEECSRIKMSTEIFLNYLDSANIKDKFLNNLFTNSNLTMFTYTSIKPLLYALYEYEYINEEIYVKYCSAQKKLLENILEKESNELYRSIRNEY